MTCLSLCSKPATIHNLFGEAAAEYLAIAPLFSEKIFVQNIMGTKTIRYLHAPLTKLAQTRNSTLKTCKKKNKTNPNIKIQPNQAKTTNFQTQSPPQNCNFLANVLLD
jgi:hypothetical protein